MPLILPWTSIAASTALIAFLLLLSFSRSRPMQLGLVISMGTCIHILATLYWTYLLHSTGFREGEIVFRFGLHPLLPSVIFWSCALLGVGMLILIPVILRIGSHSPRTRICLCFAALTLSVNATITSLAPWRTQQSIEDHFAPPP